MSSIDTAKKAANWQHPNTRAGCVNCKHGSVQADNGMFCGPSWRCARHGFFTHKHAICNDWADAVGVRS